MNQRIALLVTLSTLLLAGHARAEEVLFIGNSLSRNVPPVIERIAEAQKKTFAFDLSCRSGTAWDWHLKNPATAEKLGERKWDYVVIQDLSDRPTRSGHVAAFMADGEKLYRLIRAKAPQAKIVLYQTYAYADGAKDYTEKPTDKTFANGAGMTKELVDNYGALKDKLEALEPGDQLLIAPFGAAFQLMREADATIAFGKYLSALVLYATLFNDAPPAAVPGTKIPVDVSVKLAKATTDALATTRAPK
jgi:hypothetical protein